MPDTFKRKTFREARAILNGLCVMLDGKSASTNKNSSSTPNPDGDRTSWWIENDETIPQFDSPRCRAYLRAYVEIAGPVFFGTGIPLKDGFMHPDRGVMKAMLLADCVTLGTTKPGLFELGQNGRQLIAGIQPPNNPA